MPLRIACATDVGRRRSANQDRLLVDEQLRLLIVADGMGGHAAGEVAAAVAADSIREFVAVTAADPDRTWPVEFDEDLSFQANQLRAAVLVANRRISERTSENEHLRGMGATLAAGLVGEDRIVVSNVGDCRAYLLRDGRLSRLTHDHSWVAEQVAQGFLSEQAARVHPWRHMVTRALQGDEALLVDVAEHPLRPNDRLLLCSDGLHGPVPDEAIAAILRSHTDSAGACAALVEAANAGGGPDNISVIVADLVAAEDPAA
jgi:protein phosphatase